MGQLGNLTNPGTAMMSSASGGEPLFIGTPSQVQQHLGQSRDAVIKSGINNPVMNPKPQPAFPAEGQPSFQQAATAGATPGGVNALSPGLNKAGKLITILTSGLKGAMAGRAASEQTVAASGGRRSGGAGMGFEAAQAYPWQQAMQQMGPEKEQAQIGALKAQSQMIDTPYGRLPQGIAKVIFPAQIRAGATTEAADTRAASAEKTTQMHTDSAESIAADKLKAAQGGMQIPVDETVANLAGMPSLAGKSVGTKDWDTINKALTAKGYKTQDLGQEGMWLLDRGGNRIKRVGESPGVGRMQALAQSHVVAGALDPNEPGNLTYMSAGQAQKVGALAPGSAPTAAAKKAATSAVPTNVGNQVVAFNTALQHANLLRQALGAMQNGDIRALNSLKNRFKTEFGSADVTNFQTISQAYSDEVQKMLSGGHITEGEQKLVQGKLPSNASPQQILGALQQYESLAQSKLNMLQQQVKAAKAGGAKNVVEWHVENGQLIQGPPKK